VRKLLVKTYRLPASSFTDITTTPARLSAAQAAQVIKVERAREEKISSFQCDSVWSSGSQDDEKRNGMEGKDKRERERKRGRKREKNKLESLLLTTLESTEENRKYPQRILSLFLLFDLFSIQFPPKC